jgi:hypothetical protein
VEQLCLHHFFLLSKRGYGVDQNGKIFINVLLFGPVSQLSALHTAIISQFHC